MRISDWSSDVCSSDLPLVRTDGNAKPVPSLAESWTVDGNVWTFKLRSDVKFSDGSPFTAEDVLFTYDRVPKVPNSPSSYSLYLSSIDRSEEHTSEPQSLMRISYAVFCLKKKHKHKDKPTTQQT